MSPAMLAKFGSLFTLSVSVLVKIAPNTATPITPVKFVNFVLILRAQLQVSAFF